MGKGSESALTVSRIGTFQATKYVRYPAVTSSSTLTSTLKGTGTVPSCMNQWRSDSNQLFSKTDYAFLSLSQPKRSSHLDSRRTCINGRQRVLMAILAHCVSRCSLGVCVCYSGRSWRH